MPSRYDRRHTIVAKCTIGLLLSLSLALAIRSEKVSFTSALLGSVALVAFFLLVYEGTAHLLALALSRVAQRIAPLHAVSLAHESAIDSTTPLPDRPFKVRDGLLCLALFVGAQLAVWVPVGIIAAARAGLGAPASAIQEQTASLAPMALPLSLALGGAALLLFLRRCALRPDWVSLQESFGLTWGRPKDSAVTVVAGSTLAALFVILGPLVANPHAAQPGFLATLAAAPGPGRLAWAVTATLLAPPAEEILFRGVLIHSFHTAISIPMAALSSGFLFWLMHLPETLAYWPATVSIALMATLVTIARVRSKALGPAVLGHVAYNATLAAIVLGAA